MKKISLLLSLSLFFTLANAQVKSPAEFLGYELGERFTPHHQVIAYFQHVAENSEKVELMPYGKTNEWRPLYLAFVSTENNLARKENIRKANMKRAAVIQENVPDIQVPIVWLSYNVHGNESVSTNASMATLYELVSGKEGFDKYLDNTLVVIDPCVNPDGYDRYVSWYNQVQSFPFNPNPQAKEHAEPWPRGRANHYLFDLNRDWAWQSQVESQQRLKVYNQWLPHIHVDFHEQGVNEPYYFAPAAEPFHELITSWQREFQTSIGKNHAKYFDKNSWLYFTRERFDLFYPSYGDTWPTYTGAIGMTYEQGGSGRAGLGIITEEGDTLTLKDRIAHHHMAGLSTIEITSINAERVVSEHKKFFDKNISNPAGKYKSYVIKADNDPEKLKALKSFLDKQEIIYGQAGKSATAKGYNYQNQREENVSIASSDWVISAFQPKSVLLQVLFDPNPALADSITYDITAWALPYVFGLNAFGITTRLEPSGAASLPSPNQVSPNGEYLAYIMPWKGMSHVQMLADLHKHDIKMRYATEAFSVEGKSFDAGSIIITRKGNKHLGSKFDELVISLAKKYEVNLASSKTGFVDSGKDFGSGDVPFLHRPNIILLSGDATSSLAFGEAWHYFEQQIGYPVTVIDADRLPVTNLSEFNVIVMPNGYYSYSETVLNKLADWVRGGGKIVALEGALRTFADKSPFGLTRYFNEDEKKKAEADGKKEEEKAAFDIYAKRERNQISNYISGAIYKVTLDNTHPMAMGYGNTYHTMKNNSNNYALLKGGWNVGMIKSKNDKVAGFAGYKIQDKLDNSLVFGVESLGRGRMVYMSDNPLFRAFWENGKLFFANAIFLVGNE